MPQGDGGEEEVEESEEERPQQRQRAPRRRQQRETLATRTARRVDRPTIAKEKEEEEEAFVYQPRWTGASASRASLPKKKTKKQKRKTKTSKSKKKPSPKKRTRPSSAAPQRPAPSPAPAPAPPRRARPASASVRRPSRPGSASRVFSSGRPSSAASRYEPSELLFVDKRGNVRTGSKGKRGFSGSGFKSVANDLEVQLLQTLQELDKRKAPMEERLQVYRDLFDAIIEHDVSYGSLLRRIRDAYNEYIFDGPIEWRVDRRYGGLDEQTRSIRGEIERDLQSRHADTDDDLSERMWSPRGVQSLRAANEALMDRIDRFEESHAHVLDKLEASEQRAQQLDDTLKDHHATIEQLRDELREAQDTSTRLERVVESQRRQLVNIEEQEPELSAPPPLEQLVQTLEEENEELRARLTQRQTRHAYRGDDMARPFLTAIPLHDDQTPPPNHDSDSDFSI